MQFSVDFMFQSIQCIYTEHLQVLWTHNIHVDKMPVSHLLRLDYIGDIV